MNNHDINHKHCKWLFKNMSNFLRYLSYRFRRKSNIQIHFFLNGQILIKFLKFNKYKNYVVIHFDLGRLKYFLRILDMNVRGHNIPKNFELGKFLFKNVCRFRIDFISFMVCLVTESTCISWKI